MTTPSKLHHIQDHLRAEGVDGWLLYGFRDQNPIALAVAGIRSGGSRRWLLWIPTEGAPVWIVQAIERTTFLDLPQDLRGEVILYVGRHDLEGAIKRVVRAAAGPARTILMEYSPGGAIPTVSRVDAGTLEMIRALTGAEVRSSADAVQLAVARIDKDRIAGHRRAAAVCAAAKDEGFALIADRLRAGRDVSEYDVQCLVAQRFQAQGMEALPCIVAVNGNAADPHYAPTESQSSIIRRGDVVLIDLWTREYGDPEACYADMTWCAYCGTEVPDQVTAVFDVVLRGRDHAVELMRERLSAGRAIHGYEVDDACREVIRRAGYGEAFFHRTGHSLGSSVHYIGVNIDNLETMDRRRLLPGLLFTIEPGVYLPGLDFDGSGRARGLGVRSEINCWVHEGGIEVTTQVQHEIVTLSCG